MTTACTDKLGLATHSLWTEVYIKYGDTLYNKYRIIYLVVVKDNDYACKRNR